jgi:hypothetical protein
MWMPITLGDTTISGLGVGGLPSGSVNANTLATSSVSASKINVAGYVLQTVVNWYPAAWASDHTANSWFNWPLSCAITPLSSSSKILIMLNVGNSYMGNGGIHRILRNGSVMFQADSASSRALGMWKTATPYGTDGNHGTGFSYNYLDSPGTTSSITYSWQGYNERNTGNVYLNASVSGYNSDNSGAFYGRSSSNMMLLEIDQ